MPTLYKSGEGETAAPALLGLWLYPTNEIFLSLKSKDDFPESLVFTYLARKVGSILVPILQLGKRNSHEVTDRRSDRGQSIRQGKDCRLLLCAGYFKLQRRKTFFQAYVKRSVSLWVSWFHVFSKCVPAAILGNEDGAVNKAWELTSRGDPDNVFSFFKIWNVFGEKSCEENENIVEE